MSDYDSRLKRMQTAVELKEADRVPISPPAQCWPVLRAGVTMKDVLYDIQAGVPCFLKYAQDFEPDALFGHQYIFMGKGPLMERMRQKTMDWAGNPKGGIPDNSIHQFIEYPVLLEEDMDFFRKDYGGWLLEKGLPAVSGLLESFKGLQLSRLGSLYAQTSVAEAFSAPGVRETIEELWAINDMNTALTKAYDDMDDLIEAHGYPVLHKGFAMVPFDEYSDYYRGTVEAMMDLFEKEDMIRAFCEARLAYTLDSIRLQGRFLKGRYVFIPLHKGMDKFMSDDQFRRLYWADLRTIIEEIVACGMTPYVYTEGPYDSRLEALTEVPAGKVIYHFETVNMARAKKILGGTACIAGGFPAYMLQFGTKEKIIEDCKRLLDVCAPGGGFIFETGSGFDDAKEENVEAMFRTVKDFGGY